MLAYTAVINSSVIIHPPLRLRIAIDLNLRNYHAKVILFVFLLAKCGELFVKFIYNWNTVHSWCHAFIIQWRRRKIMQMKSHPNSFQRIIRFLENVKYVAKFLTLVQSYRSGAAHSQRMWMPEKQLDANQSWCRKKKTVVSARVHVAAQNARAVATSYRGNIGREY